MTFCFGDVWLGVMNCVIQKEGEMCLNDKRPIFWSLMYMNNFFLQNIQEFSCRNRDGKLTLTSPGEWGGGMHMSTTPWPSRTDTPPLAFPLNAPRSESRDDKQPSSAGQKNCTSCHISFWRGNKVVPSGSLQLISFRADSRFDLMEHE